MTGPLVALAELRLRAGRKAGALLLELERDQPGDKVVAAKLANMEQGGDRRSDQAANLPLDAISQPEAAAMLSVSTRAIQSVRAPDITRMLAALAAGESGPRR